MRNYSTEEKDQILKEVKETGNVAVVAKKHGIATSTIHTWLNRLKNKDVISSKKTIRQLEKQLADKELENRVLKELLKKTNQAWLKD